MISTQEGSSSMQMPGGFTRHSYTSADLVSCDRPWDQFHRHRRTAELSEKKHSVGNFGSWCSEDITSAISAFRKRKQEDCHEFRDREFYIHQDFVSEIQDMCVCPFKYMHVNE